MKNFIKSLYNFISNKFYFKLLYLFISISVTTMLLLTPGVRFSNQILILWGILLIAINGIQLLIKRRRPYSFEILLYSFLALTLILTIFKYPTLENIKAWVINTMIFTVIFSIEDAKPKHTLKKELKLLSFAFVSFTFILSSISTIMILFGDKVWISETYKGEWISYGFTTLFANENSLGIAAILSFVIGLYLLFNSTLLFGKVFNITNCAVQLLTMYLSNCRSAYLVLLALLFVYIFVYIKDIRVRFAMFFVPLTTLSIILIFFSNKLDSILSGREEYWRSALSIIKTSPLTGVGNSNLVPMIKEFNPTFPAALEAGGLHNIYLQIATVNGLLSLIFILGFIILVFFFLVKKIDNLYNYEKIKYTTLLGLFVGIALINLLESTLVYGISFIGLIFWIYSGYLVSIFHKNRNII